MGPPSDLRSLDRAVQEQFEELWAQCEEAALTKDRERMAAAWGDLARWFDIYQYGDSAARSYENAHRLAPDDGRWPYHLGVLNLGAGRLDAAQEDLATAASLAPTETAPRVRLGDLALERQDLEQAGELYGTVLQEKPNESGALLGRGRLALLRGEPRKALEDLERVAREQPEAAQVQYALGLAWRQLGDEEKAAAHFDAVPEENLHQIPLDNGWSWDRDLASFDRGARTLTRRGLRAYRRGAHGRAAKLLGAAVIADPVGPEKRVNYALALRGIHRNREALEELEIALQLAAPGSELAAKAHLELGRLLTSKQRMSEAEEHLRAALEGDPRSSAPRLELARFLQIEGRLDESLAHYASARAEDRTKPEVCFWHGAVLIALGRHAEAGRVLEEDLERFGQDRQIALLFARLLAGASEPALRDPARAERVLGVADGTEPDVLHAETAAMVAAANGRFEAAVAWQTAAIEVLGGLKRPRADHIAQRRLALYASGEPCTTPWEPREFVVKLAVERPVEGNRS